MSTPTRFFPSAMKFALLHLVIGKLWHPAKVPVKKERLQVTGDTPRQMDYEGRDMSYVLRTGFTAALGIGLMALGFPGISRADVTHTVARGHTIEAIAQRYHVTPKSIMDANHIKDPKHIKVGETLTIPGVKAEPAKEKAKVGKDGKPQKPITYAMRPKTPGIIHATRLATSEDFSIKVSDRRGHQSPTALKTFEKMLRASSGAAHPIEPRLIALLGVVSNHFGSRKLEIVSGFRPYSPTQHTAHSNHNIGHAIDFRVSGVPNEVLRDYVRTLKNVGVGYYPNSTFVHLDVRLTAAFWIDYSRPGEPPRYNAPGVDADEGTSDVTEEPHLPDPIREAMDPSNAPGDRDLLPMNPAPSASPSPSSTPSPAPTPTPSSTPIAKPTPGPSSAPTPSAAPALKPAAPPMMDDYD
jgi:uncharacterized protein YcbK (DUF882 family)